MDRENELNRIKEIAGRKDESAVKELWEIYSKTEDKIIKKEIKRALYKLGLSGLDTKFPLNPPFTKGGYGGIISTQTKFQPRFYKAFMSSYDMDGSRAVFFIKEYGFGYEQAEGVDVLTNDTKGLIGIRWHNTSKRKIEKEIRDYNFPIVEIPENYAQYLLEEGNKLYLSKKDNLKESSPGIETDFKKCMEFVGKSDTNYEQSPIYSKISPLELFYTLNKELEIRTMMEIFNEREMSNWFITKNDEIKKFVEKYKEIGESRIYIINKSPEIRRQELYLEAANYFFDEELKMTYKRRLEDTAYIFYITDRIEKAKFLLNIAKSLGDFSVSPSTISFAVVLTMRSIEACLNEETNRNI